MSDDKIEVELNEELQNEQPNSNEEEKVLSGIEKLAADHGWNPEGEKTADEYIAFALENLPERGKQLKRMQKTMDSLIEHNKKQEQAAYERAKRELEEQRIEAIQRGDVATVHNIEREAQKLQPVQETHAAVVDFQERNSEWLQGTSAEDRKMQAFAFGMDNILMTEHLSPEDHMSRLEDMIKEQFPDYFGISAKVRSPVESGVGSNVSKNKSKKNYTYNDLTEQQRKIAEEFEFYKIMTKEEYIKDLLKSGELK